MMDGVTIGQAAAFAGVTVKTIRHYHQHGLIDEPRRDASGYRRYGSADLLRLVQVRTLAAAGVPLAEIGTILDADPDRFAAALVDVERRLTDRIEELIARRDTLQRLANGGDWVLLPDRACALLDRAPGLGFTADDVALAREALVLVRALAPEDFDDYLSQVERAIEDPRWVSLNKRVWDAGEWELDDPRIDELATAVVDHLLAHPSLLPSLTGLQTRADGAIRYELLRHYGEEQKPAWARLSALIEAKLRAAGIEISELADQTPTAGALQPHPGSSSS